MSRGADKHNKSQLITPALEKSFKLTSMFSIGQSCVNLRLNTANGWIQVGVSDRKVVWRASSFTNMRVQVRVLAHFVGTNTGVFLADKVVKLAFCGALIGGHLGLGVPDLT